MTIRCVGHTDSIITCVLQVDNIESIPEDIVILPDSLAHISDKDIIANYYIRDKSIQSRDNIQTVIMISDYNVNCGIATYTKYLCDELKLLVSNLVILAEDKIDAIGSTLEDEPYVIRCWERSSADFNRLYQEVEKLNPDLIIIQHEFGLFHKMDSWNCLLSQLSRWRVVVTFHTVLEHRVPDLKAQLDYRTRFMAEAPCREIIVHTPKARDTLRDRGYSGRVHYIPHGCFKPQRLDKLPVTKYDMFSSYSIFQYGFGGSHKGWEFAIDTVELLVEKYPDVIYVGLFNVPIFERNDIYFRKLLDLVKAKGLEKNVALHRGFQSEDMLKNFIRSCRVALFPYQVPNKNWCSWGASGAIQMPISLGIPMILSQFPAFVEYAGRLPIVASPQDAATEIDRIFSDAAYATQLSEAAYAISEERSWDKAAKWYLSTTRDEDFDALPVITPE
jgi:glycosyltransferase involved in cell wall biosynthesis